MNILKFAQSLPDHRQEVKIRHLSTDIIFMTVAAVICGAQDWEDIEYFGHCKEEFFRTYLEYLPMIPLIGSFQTWILWSWNSSSVSGLKLFAVSRQLW